MFSAQLIFPFAGGAYGYLLFRTHFGAQPTLVASLCSRSYASSLGLVAIALLALHILDSTIHRQYRYTARVDRGSNDYGVLPISPDLGHEQCPRSAATATASNREDRW